MIILLMKTMTAKNNILRLKMQTDLLAGLDHSPAGWERWGCSRCPRGLPRN